MEAEGRRDEEFFVLGALLGEEEKRN